MAGDSSLIDLTCLVMTQCMSVFEDLTSLVDVEGGTSEFTKAIAQNFPNLECLVCDLPHVVANQHRTENLDFVAGNMLEMVPPGDAILLKLIWQELALTKMAISILHDWSDDGCVKILKNCNNAIPERSKGGKVNMDMAMLVLHGAKETTEKEWAKLFQDAGFSNYKVFPVLGLRCLVEVYPD
ncbi:unnamed protein product [Coffea canephora]|uniref:O-methyltransferase C-terminal domain-containing protein n=1 Tax=Coffea canephora TaxID=49390 RepID=A0A068VC62_COFCA|nr:unnamed protein product [Coffea canephora]